MAPFSDGRGEQRGEWFLGTCLPYSPSVRSVRNESSFDGRRDGWIGGSSSTSNPFPPSRGKLMGGIDSGPVPGSNGFPPKFRARSVAGVISGGMTLIHKNKGSAEQRPKNCEKCGATAFSGADDGIRTRDPHLGKKSTYRGTPNPLPAPLQIDAARSAFSIDHSKPLLTVIVNGAGYFCGTRTTESCTTCTTTYGLRARTLG